jgi:hypothetical protein
MGVGKRRPRDRGRLVSGSVPVGVLLLLLLLLLLLPVAVKTLNR